MNSRAGRAIGLLTALLVAASIAWGGFAWWKIEQARRSGRAMAELLDADWPRQGNPREGTREKLDAAAGNLRDGDFRSASASLQPPPVPSERQRTAAARFFADERQSRTRFLAAAAEARSHEAGGADVSVVRDALAGALIAAADGSSPRVAEQLELAERTLERIALGETTGANLDDPAAVASLVRQIEPALMLGRELMTEGHAAAEKLLTRASRHAAADELRSAAMLIKLAAALLGVEASASSGADAEVPEWFASLAETSPAAASVSKARATAAVELCEAMAASLEPSRPATVLIRRARSKLDAGRADEAAWWAAVALNALGMTDQDIAAALAPSPTEHSE